MPKISVVTATYNRSNVLVHAIESVRRSTLSDWELLVMGDACTDDTQDVVARFDDPRIRFVNLDRNSGDQARPNSVGAGMARAPYVAFLNHDDMYFPDHLESGIAHLEANKADLVFAAIAVAEPRTVDKLARHEYRFTLAGVSDDGEYHPYVYAPASGWVLRRSLMDQLDGWRSARDCYIESSQDFLFRAWRAGKRLVALPAVTVLAVQSGNRKDSYKERQFAENAHYAAQMAGNQQFREEMLASAALQSAQLRVSDSRKLNCTPIQLFSVLSYRSICKAGIHPRAIRMFFRYGRGGWIQKLRSIRGLE